MQRSVENSPFSLNFIEVKFLEDFHKLVKMKVNPALIFSLLVQPNIVDKIIKLAEFNVTLANWCCKEEMQAHWNEVWKKSSLYPTWNEAQKDSKKIYRPLLPQVTISSFDLVRGNYFYKQAKLLEANADLFTRCLNIAIKYHNFAALQDMTDSCLENLTSDAIPQALSLICKLELSSPVHGTPVYLLIAKIYFFIALTSSENEQDEKSDSAYQEALTYLYAAKYSQSKFEEAIHNAYHGQGLVFSSELNINNIDTAIETLLEDSPLKEDQTAREIAEEKGRMIANKITKLENTADISCKIGTP